MAPPNPRRKSWSRPLADLVAATVDPVFARQGFSESDLILHWDDIVGERIAAASRPIKLQWPPRPAGRSPDVPPQPATLVIRVEGGMALELQHRADQVLARVNAHLGWRCIGKLAFRQGPIEREEGMETRRRRPSDSTVAAAAAKVEGIEDDALRRALGRLALHAAAKSQSDAAIRPTEASTALRSSSLPEPPA